MKLPIKRKICKIGTGRAVFLPKSWIDFIEAEHGRLDAVAIEVDGVLIISPVFKEKPGE